jgi:hypothetical protein
MKGYLGPRLTGIDTLELYSSGLRTYWQDVGAGSLTLAHAEGTLPWLEAGELIRERIDSGLIVPFLLLRHQNRALKDYHWHWFNLAGYDERQGGLKVKVVTYGSFRWLDFRSSGRPGTGARAGLSASLPLEWVRGRERMAILDQVKGGLIVSCQALDEEPLHGPMLMAAMARAAALGGAVAIRTNGYQEVEVIKKSQVCP